MNVPIKRITGSSADVSGATFKRLGVIKARLRSGYQAEYYPYPNESGKWYARIVRPARGASSAKVESYFEIVAKSQDEVRDLLMKDSLWNGALMERVARKIGNRGEAFAIRRFAAGQDVVDEVTGKVLKFDTVRPIQNNSGHGIDMMARMAQDARPTPPPRKGDFIAFEVKSTLGAINNPPPLSRAQKSASTFVRSRVERARQGHKGFAQPNATELRFLTLVRDAIKESRMHYRKVNIRMDHSGQLASVGGKQEIEVLQW